MQIGHHKPMHFIQSCFQCTVHNAQLSNQPWIHFSSDNPCFFNFPVLRRTCSWLVCNPSLSTSLQCGFMQTSSPAPGAQWFISWPCPKVRTKSLYSQLGTQITPSLLLRNKCLPEFKPLIFMVSNMVMAYSVIEEISIYGMSLSWYFMFTFEIFENNRPFLMELYSIWKEWTIPK